MKQKKKKINWIVLSDTRPSKEVEYCSGVKDMKGLCLLEVNFAGYQCRMKSIYVLYVGPGFTLWCEYSKPFLLGRDSSRGLVVKVLNRDIVESEVERQSRYYVNFWINTLGERHDHTPILLLMV